MSPILYPPTPDTVPGFITEPSPAFKKEVLKVMGAIILFFLVYFCLTVLAALLAVGSCYGGLLLIMRVGGLLSVMVGSGLIMLGVGVIYFLAKFLFTVKKDENGNRIEITEAEEPALFAFIRQLTRETQTPFPGKIYLSPDVNACVFYDSSFRSLFFPVRKNLEIGLGLVNSLNISEFKAVMAHEFGHFSQDSMKLGSVTYHVNRIIHDILFHNTGYNHFLNAWGRIHRVLALFAAITAQIASCIQWVLRKMYTLINRNFMGLSRQMEFHADAVAASVTGSNNLVSALHRTEITRNCYQIVIGLANEGLKEQKVSGNIYKDQAGVLRTMSDQYRWSVQDGLPVVYKETLQLFHPSRVNYKNQWASHPSLEERTEHLERMGLPVAPLRTTPWSLFADPVALQERVTRHLYRHVKFDGRMPIFTGSALADDYRRQLEHQTLPPVYQGYYDHRFVDMQEWDLEILGSDTTDYTFEAIFSADNIQLPNRIRTGENDLALIKAIRDRTIETATFDFNGQKFSWKDASMVVRLLETELDAQRTVVELLDRQAYTFFYRQAVPIDPEKAQAIRTQYDICRHLQYVAKSFDGVVEPVIKQVVPFFRGDWPIAHAIVAVERLREELEPPLKRQLRDLLLDPGVALYRHKVLSGKIQVFLYKDYPYFTGKKFQTTELNDLLQICSGVRTALKEELWERFKDVVTYQL